MQQTYQDRLSLDAQQQRWLDSFGELCGRLQRTLYSKIAKGENASMLKLAFCDEHGLSPRQFNALRMELEGKISGTHELLKLRKKELKGSIQSVMRSTAKPQKDIAGQLKLHANANAKAKGVVFSMKRHALLCLRHFGKNRRLLKLLSKSKAVDARLQANAPGICFGSRKLFNQQFHLHQSTFGGGENWLGNFGRRDTRPMHNRGVTPSDNFSYCPETVQKVDCFIGKVGAQEGTRTPTKLLAST